MAPDFTLPNQWGTPISLGDFLGKKHIVLFFYPRDHTAVCTEEACSFRDSYEVFKALEAEKFRLIYRYVYSNVGNREETEDLTSEIFLKAVSSFDQEPGLSGTS
ncbi:MAG: redoxin domain-containing protein [Ktedonobacteraceae bacterium]